MKDRFNISPIMSMDDLQQQVQRLGFLPMFGGGIRGFSVYENTPRFWSSDDDGPWEWKGPMIQEGNVAYGKFYNRKAGYVSLDWLPDFINYRRTKLLAPNEDAAALDDIVLQTIEVEGRVTIKDLRRLLGLNDRRRQRDDLVMDSAADVKVNLDTNLTRLMMEGRVCIADFVYNIDRHGNPYGWGIAKYTTPTLLYGSDIRATCPPLQSYQRMLDHLRAILPGIPDSQITKLLG